jgi:hypothetical protein
MSSPGPAASQQAVAEAALVLLERMALSPADLVAAPASRAAVPTFAEYVPVVSATASPGRRRAYGSYWNRVVEHWDGRRLDEPGPQGRQAPPPALDPPGRRRYAARRDQPGRRDYW